MKDIIVIGAGGCMRELVWQMQEQNKISNEWNILGYVDSNPEKGELCVGKQKIPYLGNDEFILQRQQKTNVAIMVGETQLRKKIAEKYKTNKNICFPNIILSNTYICDDLKIGEGVIISMDCRVSTNVSIGDFVFLNMGSKVRHDSIIGNYVTLAPDVSLAGDTVIGDAANIGISASTIQGITIGNNAIVGAGSVVIRDVQDNMKVVGVPAKQLGD